MATCIYHLGDAPYAALYTLDNDFEYLSEGSEGSLTIKLKDRYYHTYCTKTPVSEDKAHLKLHLGPSTIVYVRDSSGPSDKNFPPISAIKSAQLVYSCIGWTGGALNNNHDNEWHLNEASTRMESEDQIPRNTLILNNLRLHSLPEFCFKALNLTNCDLSNNKFRRVPLNIRFCEHLIKLNFSNNELESVEDLEQVKSLRTLDLSHNRLKEKPDLPFVRELNTPDNPFEDVKQDVPAH